MSGTDIDNAAAAAAASQTELNRRNGGTGTNSGVVGTIIPREELQ